MKYNTILKIASLLALVAVAFGAFGAHGLRDKIDAHSLEIWETATHYQFYHVFALIATAIFIRNENTKLLQMATRFFILGIALFSGSLYLLAIKSLFIVDLFWLGPVTPIGGLCLMIAWLCLFLSFSKKNPESQN